jgi:acetyl esterase/lipase
MLKTIIFSMAVTACISASTADSNKPVTKLINYKIVDNSKLKMRIYYPPNWKSGGQKLPAVVFFFGGGWVGGSIGHLSRQAKHLAQRGMIAICPQYRTRKSHKVTPDKCLEDAKSAMRYVYSNADKLGIDKTRIAAGGGSAGGHLAAATAFCKGFNAPDDDLKINCQPVALVLFNPVIDNSEKGYGYSRVDKFWKDFSPLHNIGKNTMPVLFMIGDKDTLIPLATAKAFKEKIDSNGGRCELIIYPKSGHGFFNYSKKGKKNKYYSKTINDMDKFMVDLGFIAKQK